MGGGGGPSLSLRAKLYNQQNQVTAAHTELCWVACWNGQDRNRERILLYPDGLLICAQRGFIGLVLLHGEVSNAQFLYSELSKPKLDFVILLPRAHLLCGSVLEI